MLVRLAALVIAFGAALAMLAPNPANAQALDPVVIAPRCPLLIPDCMHRDGHPVRFLVHGAGMSLLAVDSTLDQARHRERDCTEDCTLRVPAGSYTIVSENRNGTGYRQRIEISRSTASISLPEPVSLFVPIALWASGALLDALGTFTIGYVVFTALSPVPRPTTPYFMRPGPARGLDWVLSTDLALGAALGIVGSAAVVIATLYYFRTHPRVRFTDVHDREATASPNVGAIARLSPSIGPAGADGGISFGVIGTF